MSYLTRYQELLKAQGLNHLIMGDILFREYNKIIIPLGPIIRLKPAVSIDTKLIFNKLKGKLIWWSYTNNDIAESDWYGVVKKRHFELADYRTSNIRNQIRKGLKCCYIEKVVASEIVEKGYEVFCKATQSIKGPSISKSDYQANILRTELFADIIDYWGIYIDNSLKGYAIIYKYEKLEANISEIRIDPSINKFYPSYSLFHLLSEFYLKNEKFEYLSDGYRNLVHETQIQELLISKFGFEKVYLILNLRIKFPINFMVNILYLFRKFIKHKGLQAIFKLNTVVLQQKKGSIG